MSPPRSNDEAASPSGGVPSEIPPTLQVCFASLGGFYFSPPPGLFVENAKSLLVLSILCS